MGFFVPPLPKPRNPRAEAWMVSLGLPWGSGEPVVQVPLGVGRVRVGLAQYQAVPQQLEEGVVVAEEDERQ